MAIKKKLIATFLFLLILPCLCLQVWSYRVVNVIMLEHICQAEMHALNSAAKVTQSVFTEMNRILTWLSTDTRVRMLIQTEADKREYTDTQSCYEQLKASEQILDQSLMLLMK